MDYFQIYILHYYKFTSLPPFRFLSKIPAVLPLNIVRKQRNSFNPLSSPRLQAGRL